MVNELINAIAAYLRGIHTEILRPACPGRLAEVREWLMVTHLEAERLFTRPRRPLSRCKSNDDCRQDEECIDGVCTPIPYRFNEFCKVNDDCRQEEECIDGVCTPVPFLLDYAPLPVQRDAATQLAIDAYLDRILGVLVRGLGADPRKLMGVRDLLMAARARAATASGEPRTSQDDACPDGSRWVDGHCVPLPFGLRFRAIGGELLAPWREENGGA